MKNAGYIFKWLSGTILFVVFTVIIISLAALLVKEKNKAVSVTCSINTALNQSIINQVQSMPESETEAATEPTLPSEYLIDDFEVIYQLPQLPTGCEITAFTMVLNYYGYNADKEEMALRFLPIKKAEFYHDKNNRLIGPDYNKYFVGNPASDEGYVCGTEAVVIAAKRFFKSSGIHAKAIDITGSSSRQLYKYISEGIPVVVWVTIEMKNRTDLQGWYTKDGRYMGWCWLDHGAVLIGYNEKTVTLADPLSGIITYEKNQFESVFESRGNKCVIIQQ